MLELREYKWGHFNLSESSAVIGKPCPYLRDVCEFLLIANGWNKSIFIPGLPGKTDK
jgi:hypothetical protein